MALRPPFQFFMEQEIASQAEAVQELVELFFPDNGFRRALFEVYDAQPRTRLPGPPVSPPGQLRDRHPAAAGKPAARSSTARTTGGWSKRPGDAFRALSGRSAGGAPVLLRRGGVPRRGAPAHRRQLAPRARPGRQPVPLQAPLVAARLDGPLRPGTGGPPPQPDLRGRLRLLVQRRPGGGEPAQQDRRHRRGVPAAGRVPLRGAGLGHRRTTCSSASPRAAKPRTWSTSATPWPPGARRGG